MPHKQLDLAMWDKQLSPSLTTVRPDWRQGAATPCWTYISDLVMC